jgi:hypothetical protein
MMGRRSPARLAIVTSSVLTVLVLGFLGWLLAPPAEALLVAAGQPNSALRAHVIGTEAGLPNPTVRIANESVTEKDGAATKFGGDFPTRRRHHFWDSDGSSGSSGRGGALSWIIFGPLIAVPVGLVALLIFFRTRRRKRRRKAGFAEQQPAQTYPPTGDGTTDERLKTLADLHVSGALTGAEFAAEKRRILGG